MPRGLKPPPYERPNWSSLNEGQKRYAMEQYNLALVHRGIDVDHPSPRSTASQDTQDSVRGLSIFTDEEGSGSPSYRYIATDNRTSNGNLTPDEEDFDTAADRALDIFSQPVPFWEHWSVAEEEEEEAEPIQPVVMSKADSTNGRAAAGGGENPAKKQKTDNATKGAGGGKVGSAGSQADIGGGTLNDVAVPRPIISRLKHYWKFNHVHRFLTYAIPYTVISGGATDSGMCMVTPLAMIPWQYPFMYMTPAEEAKLPSTDVFIEEVGVRIIKRKVRTAFEANASTTSLATLNQNVFFVKGVGLQQEVPGCNFSLTYGEGDNAMVPATINLLTTADLTTMDETMWGTTNVTGTPTIPMSIVGQPIALPWYYCLAGAKSATGGDFGDAGYTPEDVGWPMIQPFIDEEPSDAGESDLLLQMSYEPTCGVYRPPSKSLYLPTMPATNMNIVNSVNVVPGEMMVNNRQANYGSLSTTGVTQSELTVNGPTTMPANMRSRYYPIERSSNVTNINQTMTATQPTIHIGIKPIPRVVNPAGVPTWLNAQGYFEVETSIILSQTQYTPFSRLARNYRAQNDMYYFTSTLDNPQRTMFSGLYAKGNLPPKP
uniref:VP2 n=1 Tax=Phoenicurus auroreus ambidensovirus TaxID=2794456 RepID=A0A8A4XDN6_9VIRU|nr:MAG: VP2 [Phoenicurus auroreus ambidensovirus]